MEEIDFLDDEKNIYQHIIFDWQQRIDNLTKMYDAYIKRYGSLSNR